MMDKLKTEIVSIISMIDYSNADKSYQVRLRECMPEILAHLRIVKKLMYCTLYKDEGE